MDFKKLLIILVISALLTVTGCQENGESEVSLSEPFIGGQNGLLMSFIPGAPPEFIFDEGNLPFGISLKLENVGEDDIEVTDGYVEIAGINPVDFGKGSQADLVKPFPNDMAAAKKNFDGTVLPGGQTIVEFGELKYMPNLHGNTDVKMRADLCYNYKTQTSTKICVKGDLLSDVEGKDICIVNEEKQPFNSGGPLHITQLREAPIGTDKIQVSFTVDHVGNPSNSFYAVSADKCDDTITNPERYMVYVNVVSDINGKFPKCDGLEMPTADRSAGYVRLFEGEPRVVTCTLDVSGIDSTFEELFEVDLDYKYLQSIETQVQVRDVATK